MPFTNLESSLESNLVLANTAKACYRDTLACLLLVIWRKFTAVERVEVFWEVVFRSCRLSFWVLAI